MMLTNAEVQNIVEEEFNTEDSCDDIDTILQTALAAAIKVRDRCQTNGNAPVEG